MENEKSKVMQNELEREETTLRVKKSRSLIELCENFKHC